MTNVPLPFSTDAQTILVVQFVSSCLDPKFCNRLLELPSNSRNNFISSAQVNEHWSNEEEEVHVLPDDTPPPFDIEPSIYLSIRKCKSLSFGREACQIPLPNRRGISKKHFRIYLSPYSTWMVSCNSRNALILNGVWVGKKCNRALNPTSSNMIEIPSVSVRILIHIVPTKSDEAGSISENEHGLEKGFVSGREPISKSTYISERKPVSESEHTDVGIGDSQPQDTHQTSSEIAESWSASGSTSTVTHLRWMGDVREAETSSTYIVLETTPMTWSSSAFSAIDAMTGERCVALRFKADESRRLIRFFLSYGQRLNHKHIARSLKVERDPPLLAQSFDGRDYLEPGSLSIGAACIALRQITDALHAAHSMGFIHGYMKAEDIIYQRSDLRYHFVLNGFWRRFMNQTDIDMPRPCTDLDKEHDYQDLSFIVASGLSDVKRSADDLKRHDLLDYASMPAEVIKDYLLREVLMAMRTTRLTEHTWAYIQGLPSFDDTLFGAIEVMRHISIEIRGIGRQAELHVSQLTELWEYHIHSTRTMRRTISAEDLSVLRLFRRYRSDFIRAAKVSTFLRMSTSETVYLRAAIDRAVKEMAAFVDLEIPIRVPCIGRMANITCLSRAVGAHFSQDLSLYTVREIRGPYEHAGLYIDLDDLKGIVSETGIGMLTWRSEPHSTPLAQKLYGVNANKFIVFATGLPWCVCVLMRRDDGRVDWDPFSQTGPTGKARLPLLTAEESCARCDEFGLEKLKEAILDSTSFRDLPSHCSNEKLELFTEDVQESDTSIETDDSDQDHLKFKRRKT